jgi:hypothetical protein
MKPKPEHDPERPSSSRRWSWRIRSIGQLMNVIALIGLALSVVPLRSQAPARGGFLKLKGVRGRQVTLPGSIGRLPAEVRPARDRFVIIAPAEIDPGMVVPADPDLDAQMVFNPETGRRGTTPGDQTPRSRPVEPEAIPEPAPGEPTPRLWTLPPAVVPEAQPR